MNNFFSSRTRHAVLGSWTFLLYHAIPDNCSHGLPHHLMYVIHLITLRVDKRLHALQTLPYCILTRRTVTYSLFHRTCAAMSV